MTTLLLGWPDDHVFWFPKHGHFELTAAALRNAAHGKSKRLPAHRRMSPGDRAPDLADCRRAAR